MMPDDVVCHSLWSTVVTPCTALVLFLNIMLTHKEMCSLEMWPILVQSLVAAIREASLHNQASHVPAAFSLCQTLLTWQEQLDHLLDQTA